MKKLNIDIKYLKISLYALFVIIVSITFEKTVGNFNSILSFITNLKIIISSVLSPFLFGLFIAYFMNATVRTLENKFFSKFKWFNNKLKFKRILSILISFIIILGLLFWTITFLVPEIISSFTTLVNQIQVLISDLETGGPVYTWVNKFVEDTLNYINHNFSTDYSINDAVNVIIEPIKNTIITMPSMFNVLINRTFNFALQTLNLVLGIVIAFYMLCEKENFANFFKRFIYVIFKKETSQKIVVTVKKSNTIFEKFIAGRAIDSFIVGVIFFICATIFDLKLALLCTIIIGFTNMIPYFGPFIGAVPVILITLINDLTDPKKALVALIIIFILQQFDGIVLGPKILGDSTGLKPMGVIFAILVGGKLFGVAGMFFGVPTVAVLKMLIAPVFNRMYNEKILKNENKNNNILEN